MSDNIFIDQQDKIRYWHKDGEAVPSLVSFTELLQWNYTADYEAYIQYLYKNFMLPFDYSEYEETGIYPEIAEVCILKGNYDRTGPLSFAMNVICGILFIDMEKGIEFTQKVRVEGTHEFNDYNAAYHGRNSSNYFQAVYSYSDNERINRQNPLDEYLVPVLNKRHFDEYAYNFLDRYYPEALDEDLALEPEKLVQKLGFKLRFELLSTDGSIRAATIFRDKWVTTYRDRKPVKKHIARNTVIVSISNVKEKRMAILHECVHILSHRLFYELQYYYRSLVEEYADGAAINYVDRPSCEGLKWAEVQADAISPHIALYHERVYSFITDFRDKEDRNIDQTNYHGVRLLIDSMASTYGVSRNSAKKRVVELGWNKARGVYEWGYIGYAEDYAVPEDTPDDETYTLSLWEMSKILGKSILFDKYVYSGAFIYADGHLCLNLPKYVEKRVDDYYLTEYAKSHMDECCIRFRRVYGEKKYRYTVGQLNQQEIEHFDAYELDAATQKKIQKARDEWLLCQFLTKQNGVTMTLGKTICHHMKRLNISVETLAQRSCMGERTVLRLRNDGISSPKFEMLLALMVGMGLEDVFQIDLLQKANLAHEITGETYQLYRLMKSVKPDITVHQINSYLETIGKKPWTNEKRLLGITGTE